MKLEEIQLYLTDAFLALNEYESTNHKVENWSDWIADHMTTSGFSYSSDELAILLREADANYQNKKEQYPKILYYAEQIELYS